jgi:Photoprotection regulator fluorescence recovery protein
MSHVFATPSTYPYRNEPIWSGPERTIARKVFDAALKRDLQDVMRKAKEMANQINEPGDVWKLERHLTERRKEIDRQYDFRSSRLMRVLGRLLCERRITEEELHGLPEDKLKAIRSCAKVLSEDAA